MPNVYAAIKTMTYNYASQRKWNDQNMNNMAMGLSTHRHIEIFGRKPLSPYIPKQTNLVRKDGYNRTNASLSAGPKRTPLKADHNVRTVNRVSNYDLPQPPRTRLNREKSYSLNNLYTGKDALNDRVNLKSKTNSNDNNSRSRGTDGLNILEKSGMIMKRAAMKMERLNIERKLSNTFNRGDSNVVSPSATSVAASPHRARSNSFSNLSNTYKPTRVNRADAPLPGIPKNRRYSLESTTNLKSESAVTAAAPVVVASKEIKTVEQKNYMSSRSDLSSGGKNRYSRFGVCGLKNLGNTCFMNSILQCLSKDKTLRSYFCSSQYKKDTSRKSRLAAAFGDLLSEIWCAIDNEVVSPTHLKMEIQRFAHRFAGTHQHDSQEFLRCLVEGVHDELNAIKSKPTFSYDDIDRIKDNLEKGTVVWNRYLSREKSIIQDLFVGQLRSTLTCSVCHYASVTFDPFWDLSLPIPTTKGSSSQVNIKECFKIFTQEEIMDGGEKPTCEKCKKRTRCTKKFMIERCPKVLVLHLKRFSGHRYRTKLTTHVSFPIELNIQEYTVSNANFSYRLFGVSNHVGGTQGGHYTAYCKHPDTSKWHLYNDSRASAVSPKDVITSAAYVLFYELIS